MVRIIRVRKLEERKRHLLAQSEMYRQTLTLEVANIKFSAALFKHKLKSRRNLFLLLGSAFPMAGLFLARKKVAKARGILPKVLSGMKLFNQVAPLFKMFRAPKSHAGGRQNITQYPG